MMTSEDTSAFVWIWLPGALEPVVCGRLDVAASNTPVWAKTSEAEHAFYVRLNNTTRELPDDEVERTSLNTVIGPVRTAEIPIHPDLVVKHVLNEAKITARRTVKGQ